jgi:hypothetical protein
VSDRQSRRIVILHPGAEPYGADRVLVHVAVAARLARPQLLALGGAAGALPGLYGSESAQAQDKIVYLYDFANGSDWWLVEPGGCPARFGGRARPTR